MVNDEVASRAGSSKFVGRGVSVAVGLDDTARGPISGLKDDEVIPFQEFCRKRYDESSVVAERLYDTIRDISVKVVDTSETYQPLMYKAVFTGDGPYDALCAAHGQQMKDSDLYLHLALCPVWELKERTERPISAVRVILREFRDERKRRDEAVKKEAAQSNVFHWKEMELNFTSTPESRAGAMSEAGTNGEPKREETASKLNPIEWLRRKYERHGVYYIGSQNTYQGFLRLHRLSEADVSWLHAAIPVVANRCVFILGRDFESHGTWKSLGELNALHSFGAKFVDMQSFEDITPWVGEQVRRRTEEAQRAAKAKHEAKAKAQAEHEKNIYPGYHQPRYGKSILDEGIHAVQDRINEMYSHSTDAMRYAASARLERQPFRVDYPQGVSMEPADDGTIEVPPGYVGLPPESRIMVGDFVMSRNQVKWGRVLAVNSNCLVLDHCVDPEAPIDVKDEREYLWLYDVHRHFRALISFPRAYHNGQEYRVLPTNVMPAPGDWLMGYDPVKKRNVFGVVRDVSLAVPMAIVSERGEDANNADLSIVTLRNSVLSLYRKEENIGLELQGIYLRDDDKKANAADTTAHATQEPQCTV